MTHDVNPLRTFLFVSLCAMFSCIFLMVEAPSVPGSCSLYGFWEKRYLWKRREDTAVCTSLEKSRLEFLVQITPLAIRACSTSTLGYNDSWVRCIEARSLHRSAISHHKEGFTLYETFMVIGFLWMKILVPKKPLFTLDLHSTRQLLAMLALRYTEQRLAICRVICMDDHLPFLGITIGDIGMNLEMEDITTWTMEF